MFDAVMNYLSLHHGRMVRELLNLAAIDSPSSVKSCTDLAISHLAERFRSLGLSVERLPQKDCGDFLLASLRPDAQTDSPPVVMLCHVDTVWPDGETRRRPPRVEGDRVLGPGVYDMKAGIIQAIFALEVIQALSIPIRNQILLLVNTDEELGSRFSRDLIHARAMQAKAVLVLEPAGPGGAVKAARKGTGVYELQVRGRASHAGADPEKGISATLELAHMIIELYAQQRLDLGTTVNVGQVKAGIARNVVAPEAWANVDLRAYTQEELSRVDCYLKGIRPRNQEASVTVKGGIARPPLLKTDASEAIYRQALQIASEFGFELPECKSGGASDGNFASAAGAPVLDGLGAEGDGPHASHEFVTASSMIRRTALLARLLLSI